MTEPNPPSWPASVITIHETDSPEKIRAWIEKVQDPWNEEYETFTSDYHFSTSRRFAVLFAPGQYRGIDFPVGYYVQLLGLGVSADDVQFVDCQRGPFVSALNFHKHLHGTCLDTFWRSAENFSSFASNGMQWAVSQACPLRRIHVHGDLNLFHGPAYASGGYFANSLVEGRTNAGGQQQFLFRNVEFRNGAIGGAWSIVYVACTGQVPRNNNLEVVVLAKPPIRIEKPFIAVSSNTRDGKFQLRVPLPLMTNKDQLVGPKMDGSDEEIRDFSQVRVVGEQEPISRIQDALDQGKDVILAAGIFTLEKTIQMKHPNQVLLGIGMATIVAPTDGSPCIRIAPFVPGVRVAGIMLEASKVSVKSDGEQETSTLLQWGDKNVKDPGDFSNPGALHDVFCRVGGIATEDRESVQVNTMMRLYSGNIVGDNLWLWRADHAELRPNEQVNYPNISSIYWQTEQNEFRVETGLEVWGDDITIYGLAVEHALGHQTIWHGDRGFVAFYQCELPYCVSQETFGNRGYRGYLVGDHVQEHQIYAPGIYSNFRNEKVVVATAMEHPQRDSVTVHNPFTVLLDNHFGIQTISNFQGGAAIVRGRPVRLVPDKAEP